MFPFLAFATLTVALLAGFVVTIIDKEDFPDYGTAVWWAVVTLGTVGYGDVVPHTGWGRVVGSGVIIVGVTFIAFLTAVVTSLFVEEEQKSHRTLVEDAQRASQDETRRLAGRRLFSPFHSRDVAARHAGPAPLTSHRVRSLVIRMAP